MTTSITVDAFLFISMTVVCKALTLKANKCYFFIMTTSSSTHINSLCSHMLLKGKQQRFQNCQNPVDNLYRQITQCHNWTKRNLQLKNKYNWCQQAIQSNSLIFSYSLTDLSAHSLKIEFAVCDSNSAHPL